MQVRAPVVVNVVGVPAVAVAFHVDPGAEGLQGFTELDDLDLDDDGLFVVNRFRVRLTLTRWKVIPVALNINGTAIAAAQNQQRQRKQGKSGERFHA
jgi:hypothetical protein